jgi:predicted O-linked N-acetylglucosamine transferase (SPINDLY family)
LALRLINLSRMSEALLRSAYGQHLAGNFAEAARLYRELLRADPGHYDAAYLLGVANLQAGRFIEAERSLDAAMKIRPGSHDAAFTRGVVLQQLGRHDEAHACYDKALALKADHWESWHNRAVARIMLQRYEDARADLDQALALKADHADSFEHRGIALSMLDRHEEALEDYNAALRLRPPTMALLRRKGDSLLRLDRLEAAATSYGQALALDAHDRDAWHNRGVALSRLGRLEEALGSYDRALTLSADFGEGWASRGSALLELKKYAEALASYDRALAIEPRSAEFLKNRGVAFLAIQRYADALSDFQRALGMKADFGEALEQQGNALSRLNRHEEALASYDKALSLGSQGAAARANRAMALASLNRFAEASDECERVLLNAPDHPYAKGLLMHCRLHTCDWRDLERQREAISADVRDGKRAISPFGSLLVSNSLQDQRRSAEMHVADFFPAAPVPMWRGERYRHGKARVAYLSADFRMHVTALVMAGVFEAHDRQRFEVTAISYGADDKSEMRSRLQRSFDRFIDARTMSDAEVAGQLREMEIDLVVDLKGHTNEGRPGILAHRAAPVQAHYMGYPGTMGAAYVDYIIADETVIPDLHRCHYSERVVTLPDTYYCYDTKTQIDPNPLTREDVGLPKHGFVFCCFNNSCKILPDIFAIWMRLLIAVPDSILWLPEIDPTATRNLRREAQSRGVSDERLIFAPFLPSSAHLARLSLAGLFLDTRPYNGHTTAADALWVGVPVVTTPGTTFVGRVAASLLKAVGLPEMVAASLEDYEALALALARNPQTLTVIKEKLMRNRSSQPLFDTVRFTRNLEHAYSEMVRRQREGKPAEGFSVRSGMQS